MKPKVYLETSIISYLAARPSRDLFVAANQQATHEWWMDHRDGYTLHISALVVQEISRGDPDAAARRRSFVQDVSLLQMDESTAILAEKLVEQGAIPRRVIEDAYHIAIAAIHGMDYLLTWNFRHIANATLSGKIAKICRDADYEPPIICSPPALKEG